MKDHEVTAHHVACIETHSIRQTRGSSEYGTLSNTRCKYGKKLEACTILLPVQIPRKRRSISSIKTMYLRSYEVVDTSILFMHSNTRIGILH